MSAIESPHAKDPQRRSIGQRLATELRRFVGMFAYLWVIFGIYVLAERIILREHGIPFTAQGLAFFNALASADEHKFERPKSPPCVDARVRSNGLHPSRYS